jgi:hypothetical protein
VAALSALREVTPPPSLVAMTMRRIAAQPAPGLWGWLQRPQRLVVRLSPAALGVFGLAIVVLAVFAIREVGRAQLARTQPPAATVVEAAPRDAVLVRFVLVTRDARKVALAGDFNGWNTEHTFLENADGKGTFAANVWLPRGAHEYMFVVDGEWVADPAAGARVPDGFGRANSVLRL